MQELCWNVATKNDINLGFETFLRLFIQPLIDMLQSKNRREKK